MNMMTGIALQPSVESSGEWDRRLSTWQKLKARRDRHPYPKLLPDAPSFERLEREFDKVVDVAAAAERFLILAPAPNRAALLLKLELLQEGRFPESQRRELFAAVRGDVERLT